MIVRCLLEDFKAEPNHQYLKNNLEREPHHYSYMETRAKVSIIPFCQNQFMQKNVFNNAPIRRRDVAVKTSSAVAGPFHGNLSTIDNFNNFI